MSQLNDHRRTMSAGFTLVELLIVIAVISILAAVAFVAIDPATRINEAQDSERWSAANALMDAFLQSTVDNDGTYPAGIAANGTVHMISSTTDASCTPTCPSATVTSCTDFDDLVGQGYIASLPQDPDGVGTFDGGNGYTLSVASTGIVTVTACGAEEAEDGITVAR
ncbi:MAG: type II secretion system protein [Candidatus Kerfeldbacteria bacterium]|nr:type II secretion system protein [Candidatus Kerfeldbacteria bacterium]